MKNTVSINDLYLNYSAGFLEKKDLEEAIFKSIKDDVHLLPGWSIDDYNDYVSWLYPRIDRAIVNYRDIGSGFEQYIGSVARMAAKEYRGRQIRDYTAESAAWITQIPDMYAAESDPEYTDQSITEPEEILTEPFKPSQLLILVLKCCSYITDDFAERIAARLEIDQDELLRMFSELKEQREKREMVIVKLQESANKQFCRCIYYQQTLQFMTEKNIIYGRMKDKLDRGLVRLSNLRKRIARLHPDPSNQQIAKLLGISKGTVDSALHNLKLHALRYPDKNYSDIILN